MTPENEKALQNLIEALTRGTKLSELLALYAAERPDDAKTLEKFVETARRLEKQLYWSDLRATYALHAEERNETVAYALNAVCGIAFDFARDTADNETNGKCSGCGHIAPWTVMGEHVAQCDKHPTYQLRLERDEAKAELAKLEAKLLKHRGPLCEDAECKAPDHPYELSCLGQINSLRRGEEAAWENRNRFCAEINKIGHDVLGFKAENCDPEAVTRETRKWFAIQREALRKTADFLEERFGNEEGHDWDDAVAGTVADYLDGALAGRDGTINEAEVLLAREARQAKQANDLLGRILPADLFQEWMSGNASVMDIALKVQILKDAS